jgi:prepilin-type N-terminal cleavage/methylation domain-containing protein
MRWIAILSRASLIMKRILHRERRGVTLLELIAVVTLLGIVVTVSIASYKPGTMGNMGAKADARHLALDMMQARRRAISTGDNHFISFATSGSTTKYAVYRRPSSGSPVQIGDWYTFQQNVTVTSNPVSPEFTFEGLALANYTVDVRGPNNWFSVTANQASGAVRVIVN